MGNKMIEILLAEDEETDVFFMQQAFQQSRVNNRLHVVKDGVELLDYLNKKNGFEDAIRPNLILLDINMPRKDGHEALLEIKTSAEWRDIPVIMLSSSRAAEDILRSYENYASAYVPKSKGLDEIMNFVHSVEKFWFERAELPRIL